MPTPARFPSGLSTRAIGHALGSYGLPDPAAWVTHFDDFLIFGASETGAPAYTVTEVGTGTVLLTAGTTEATAGGTLIMTTSAGADDSANLQLFVAPFFLTRGKKAFFRAKFRASSATDEALMFGLVPTDTTPFVSGGLTETVTAGIYFFKPENVATVLGHVEDNSTVTATAAMGTLVAATNTEWAWYYNGKTGDAGEIEWYIDNVHISTTTVLTNFPLVQLNLIAAMQNGSAAARTMTLDHLLVAVER